MTINNDDKILVLEELSESLIKMISAFYNKKFYNKDSLDIPTIQNSKFHLHPYCFCEREECFFCNYPNFVYYEYDFQIDWYKHLGRGMEIACDKNIDAELISFVFIMCKFEIQKEWASTTINHIKETLLKDN